MIDYEKIRFQRVDVNNSILESFLSNAKDSLDVFRPDEVGVIKYCFGVFSDNDLLGVCYLKDDLEIDDFYELGIFVKKECRSRGLGTQLIDYCINELKKIPDVVGVTCKASIANKSILNILKKLDFKFLRPANNDYVWYWKNLLNADIDIMQDKLWENGYVQKTNDKDRFEAIQTFIEKANLSPNSYIIDVCCGTGGVIGMLKDYFSDFVCIGIDILEYPEWFKYPKVHFTRLSIQDLVKVKQAYDVIMLLNTYRNWSGHEGLKKQFDKWIKNNAKYFIASNIDKRFNEEYVDIESLGGTVDYGYPLEAIRL
jgi:hypothetical protein